MRRFQLHSLWDGNAGLQQDPCQAWGSPAWRRAWLVAFSKNAALQLSYSAEGACEAISNLAL